MKRIITYQVFESEKNGLTLEQEAFLNECTKGQWKFDSLTGLVNVDEDFNCSAKGLKDFKNVKFGKITGGFFCHYNNLLSLTGAPQTVGGNFDCHDNNLLSLTGAPQSVGESFYCFDNQLRTLEGAPQTVGGGFFCSENKLESLIGAPQAVGGDFVCNEFVLGRDQWNPVGWMEIFVGESQEARELILSLLTPGILNQEIEKDPQGMIQVLKSVWGLRKFAKLQKELKFPDEYGDVGQTIRSLNKLDSMKDFI